MNEPSRTLPFAPFEFMLSFRYLRAQRRERWISVNAGFSFLGIMLGVATLIIVMAVMNGFRKELLDKILGLNGHLLIQPVRQPLTDWQVLAQRVAGISGVTLAAAIVDGKALASAGRGGDGVMVRGIREADLRKLGSVADNVRQGSLEDFDQSNGVTIGRRLAEKFAVGLGDSLTLMAPRGDCTPMGCLPRIKSYRVAAVFEIGMLEYDSAVVFMPLPEAQAFFNQGQAVTAVAIYTADADRIDPVRRLVVDAAGPAVGIVDWRQLNTAFFSALQVQRNVMFLILTIIVIVAAFNITSGLILLVKDKGRDIGVLRTIGATKGAVMRVYVIVGTSVGTVGTLVGLLLGAVISLNVETIRYFLAWLGIKVFPPEVYFLSRLPAEMDAGETAAVVVMGLTLSLLATLYPSWQAARLDPAEALRYG
jgi:lipoprotein-releasing system permease protein